MKLVITIDDDIYDDYLKQGATLPKYGTEIDSLYKALWNGVPLPKGHGKIIDVNVLLDEMRATRTYDIPFALERIKPIIEADKE